MSAARSSLSAIPPARRHRVALVAGGFALLWAVVGAIAVTVGSSGGSTLAGVFALVVAALLALMAWGVAHSITLDARRAARAHQCDCGHQHDSSELHVTDAEAHDTGDADAHACHSDGSGESCGHDCAACVLGRLTPQ